MWRRESVLQSPVCLGALGALYRPSSRMTLRPQRHIPGAFTVSGLSPLGWPIAMNPQGTAYHCQHCVGGTSSIPTWVPRGSLRNDVYWTEEPSEARRG